VGVTGGIEVEVEAGVVVGWLVGIGVCVSSGDFTVAQEVKRNNKQKSFGKVSHKFVMVESPPQYPLAIFVY
jgi:hypothetical protein